MIFDYAILKALYINITALHTLNKTLFFKSIQSMETYYEAFPQSILTTIFIIISAKYYQNISIIAIISWFISVYSLLSRFMGNDQILFNKGNNDNVTMTGMTGGMIVKLN